MKVTHYLLTLPGVTGQYVLSECFSQDPLENYFSRQRASGGRCDNPTASDALNSAQGLWVQGSLRLFEANRHVRQGMASSRLQLSFPSGWRRLHLLHNTSLFLFGAIVYSSTTKTTRITSHSSLKGFEKTFSNNKQTSFSPKRYYWFVFSHPLATVYHMIPH